MKTTNTALILFASGFQGGTIHQASEVSGLTTNQILDIEDRYFKTDDKGEANNGFSAISTCSLDWLKKEIYPKRKGDFKYWTNILYAMRRGEVQDPLVRRMVFAQIAEGKLM